jgi:hypothetical protein
MHETIFPAIRCLVPWEIPLCVPGAKAFHAEMRLPGLFEPEVFVARWEAYLAQFTADVLGLWSGVELIGGLGVVAAPEQYNNELVATEFFWYVDPAHRQGMGAIRLLKAFRVWGREHRAVRCRLVHLLGNQETPREAQLARVYRKLGFHLIEAAWECSLMED